MQFGCVEGKQMDFNSFKIEGKKRKYKEKSDKEA